MRVVLLAFALLLLLPLAAAREPLRALEEPHEGTDKVWDVVVTAEDQVTQRALIFRNPIGRTFTLIVYDAAGAEIFNRTGQRGIQTLPPLEPGEYRFFVRGQGEFQVTARAFERILQVNEVNATLDGAHAYVLAPSRNYAVNVTGDVDVEWWSLASEPEELEAPLARLATAGAAYVITLRGDPGAAYAIAIAPTGAAPTPTGENGAPGAPLVTLVALVALVALLTRRT